MVPGTRLVYRKVGPCEAPFAKFPFTLCGDTQPLAGPSWYLLARTIRLHGPNDATRPLPLRHQPPFRVPDRLATSRSGTGGAVVLVLGGAVAAHAVGCEVGGRCGGTTSLRRWAGIGRAGSIPSPIALARRRGARGLPPAVEAHVPRLVAGRQRVSGTGPVAIWERGIGKVLRVFGARRGSTPAPVPGFGVGHRRLPASGSLTLT
jgi:hypothetical protein